LVYQHKTKSKIELQVSTFDWSGRQHSTWLCFFMLRRLKLDMWLDHVSLNLCL